MFGIFKSNKTNPRTDVDFKNILVDFHSHLIPQVDDGVQNVEDAYAILKSFQDLGYKKIYTSPHVMGEGYTNTRDDLIARFRDLKKEESIQSLEIEFELIAEYLLDEQFEALIEKNELLSFGDNHILIETSMNYEFPFVRDYIYKLVQKGYKPILAHPERYRYIYSEKNYMDAYEELSERGVSFQLNLFSLIGMYGDQVKKVAEEIIDYNLYSFVSSDIHHPDQIKFFPQLQKSIFLAKLIESGDLKNHTLT